MSASTVGGGTKYIGLSDIYSPYAQTGALSASDADAKCDLVDAKAGRCSRDALDAAIDTLAWPATLVAQTLSNYCSVAAQEEGSCHRTTADIRLEAAFGADLGTWLRDTTTTYQNVRTSDVIFSSQVAAGSAVMTVVGGPVVIANAGTIMDALTLMNTGYSALNAGVSCNSVISNPSASTEEKIKCGVAVGYLATSFVPSGQVLGKIPAVTKVVPALTTLNQVSEVSRAAVTVNTVANVGLGGANAVLKCSEESASECQWAVASEVVDTINLGFQGKELITVINEAKKAEDAAKAARQLEADLKLASELNLVEEASRGNQAALKTIKQTGLSATAAQAVKEGNVGCYWERFRLESTRYRQPKGK